MNFNYRDLVWDTEYFGIKAGVFEVDKSISENEKLILLKKINQNNLSVIKIKKGLNEVIEVFSKETTGTLMDINLSFSMDVQMDERYEEEILKVEQAKQYDSRLVRLAKNIFAKSRFLKDKNLEKEKAKLVYSKWVENSFKQNNKFFITYEHGEQVAFLLFSYVDERTVIIELLAVDPLLSGKNIGTKLIDSLKVYSNERNIEKILVGTQLENIKAINFYFKNQFRLEDLTYIYHIWNKKGNR